MVDAALGESIWFGMFMLMFVDCILTDDLHMMRLNQRVLTNTRRCLLRETVDLFQLRHPLRT